MIDRETQVVRPEELDQEVEEILEFARERGRRVRNANKGRVYTLEHPDIPKTDGLLRDEIKAALEDEIVPAREITAEGGILPWELNHELVKKALVGLKIPSLKFIARKSQVSLTGNAEDLATRVARHYNWNEQEIARLILDQQALAVRPRDGHYDRLFPLVEAPDLDQIIDRLEYVTGRYIRIGVARWFVFDRFDATDDRLELTGSLHSYRAYVDDTGDEPTVNASPRFDTAVLQMDRGSNVLRVRQLSATGARSAVTALNAAAGVAPLGYVPLPAIAGLGGASVAFDRVTLFMLDLLENRFRGAGLHNPDLTVARFKVGEAEDIDVEGESLSPLLEAVRFEGRHILDSTEACRLIATEGRSLVNISLRIKTAPRSDGESATFPIQIGIDGWDVAVSTGFGSRSSELSVGVHQSLISALKSEISDGVSRVDSINSLAERISERAAVDRAPDRANMFSTSEPQQDS